MSENILDSTFAFQKPEEIPDRILREILHSRKKYPEKVIDFVCQEIENRNLVLSEMELENSELIASKSNFTNWIKNNPKTSILALLTAIISGFVGSIVVLISVYSATQENALVKKSIWRKANLLIIILIIGAMILSIILNN